MLDQLAEFQGKEALSHIAEAFEQLEIAQPKHGSVPWNRYRGAKRHLEAALRELEFLHAID